MKFFGLLLITVIIFFIAYIANNMYSVLQFSKHNKRYHNCLKHFDNADDFFYYIDLFIEKEKKASFIQRGLVLKLWGCIYHQREKELNETLAKIDLEPLIFNIPNDEKSLCFTKNEDVFYYLLLVIMSHLYAKKDFALMKKIDHLVMRYKKVLQDKVIFSLYLANKDVYYNCNDRGIAYYQSFLEGHYLDENFNHNLIQTYKSFAVLYLIKAAELCHKTDILSQYELDYRDVLQNPVAQRVSKELGIKLQVNAE